jgi:cation diffusion facilitator CzcD-associated flavoprotein CzcO
MGDWTIPETLRHLPSSICVHTAQPIDFASLRGKQIAVIGAGASAFDNAATALEAGAAEVHLFCRRADIQVIQPYRWLTFRGFLTIFVTWMTLALALHARHSRDAGRFSVSDLRSLCSTRQFSPA